MQCNHISYIEMFLRNLVYNHGMLMCRRLLELRFAEGKLVPDMCIAQSMTVLCRQDAQNIKEHRGRTDVHSVLYRIYMLLCIVLAERRSAEQLDIPVHHHKAHAHIPPLLSTSPTHPHPHPHPLPHTHSHTPTHTQHTHVYIYIYTYIHTYTGML